MEQNPCIEAHRSLASNEIPYILYNQNIHHHVR